MLIYLNHEQTHALNRFQILDSQLSLLPESSIDSIRGARGKGFSSGGPAGGAESVGLEGFGSAGSGRGREKKEPGAPTGLPLGKSGGAGSERGGGESEVKELGSVCC